MSLENPYEKLPDSDERVCARCGKSIPSNNQGELCKECREECQDE